jgi:hypothetical protein
MPLLDQPAEDEARRDADLALMRAMHARASLGPAPSPDAEALAVRAVVDAAPDGAMLDLLRGVWGRLDAVGRPALAVHGAEAALFAADRFGLNLRLVETPEAAIAAVSGKGRALIELGARPWWGRLLARPELRVVAAFPESRHARPRALMIAAASPGPTGDDRTFWVTDSRLPDARLVEALREAGLAAEPLAAGGGLKLFILAGYVQAEDGRLDGAPGDLSGVIGAAPLF